MSRTDLLPAESISVQLPAAAQPGGVINRVIAALGAGRYDLRLAAGSPPQWGSPLAAHAARLASAKERARMANALRRLTALAHSGGDCHGLRGVIAPNYQPIVNAEPTIDRVIALLTAHHPVRSQGIARLRLLLSDGGGPIYLGGCGNLQEELHGVIAAL